MTADRLVDAIIARLTWTLGDIRLPRKDGTEGKLKFFPQYMPQPRGLTVTPKGTGPILPPASPSDAPVDVESCFPCVVARFDEGRDEEEGHGATLADVTLVVGTFDDAPDLQGWRDVMDIIHAVRHELLALPGRVLDGRYRLEMPLKWGLADEQPWPLWIGQIETKWETGRPQMPPRNDEARRR
ncbi:MAG: hypothetical protein IJR14_07140 [Synergistaceae bacterium]|nr:hypothetical protein [Synergistaceae bacterium]